MTAKVLFILRHGQTEWNVARRMQGQSDSPLTALGRLQADLNGRTLARQQQVEALVASPLGRTQTTAELINVHLSVPLRFEPALMERDCGDWSGLTLSEIEAAYPDDWQARGRDPYHHRPPAGENLPDMEQRVAAVLADLLDGPERSLALITHGVMSRVLLKRLLDLSPGEAVTVRHPNELFYRLEIKAPGRVRSAYFLEGQGPRPGLLRENDSETIAGPAARRK